MSGSRPLLRIAGALGAMLIGFSLPQAQFLGNDGKVSSFKKITSGTNGFGGVLAVGDGFGDSTTGIGDLDGNGVQDVAVGAPGDDDGGLNRGAVWILFLDAAGNVVDEQRISDTAGGFGGTLINNAAFGTAVDCAGDLDGDGRNELVVGTNNERLFVLFLNADGTVSAEQEIAAGVGGFGGALSAGDFFGLAVGSVGDVDGDGRPELAVGAPGDDDGGANRGAVWILFLNANGTVASEQKISSTAGGLGAGLLNNDRFGTAVEGIEDLDGDGIPELVVGAPLTEGVDFMVPGPGQPPIPFVASNEGVVFVLFLTASGTVSSKVEMGQGLGGFTGMPFANDQMGTEINQVGDLDGNGVRDIVVGIQNRTTLVGVVGGFYEIFLDTDGTSVNHRLVTDKQGGFNAGLLQFLLAPGDSFTSPASVGDVDGDCKADLVVGASGDASGRGALWVLFLDGQRQATTTFRNGSGVNAVAYASTSEPRLNRTWTSEVDVTGHPGATLSVIFATDAPDTVPFALGEILVSLTANESFVQTVIPSGGIAGHSIPIPNDLALVGYEAFSQALIGGGAGPELVNAVDLKLGW